MSVWAESGAFEQSQSSARVQEKIELKRMEYGLLGDQRAARRCL